MAFRPGEWQGDNLTQELKDAGLAAGNATDYIYDFTVSQGGPIAKDKLWFFGTFRDYRTNNFISNTFYDDGAQGDDYNYIKQGLVRLTYQMGQRNKLSAYYDRVDKYRAHDMQSLTDPETASVVWTAPNYSTAALKWTSTISSRLLAEAGYSQNVEYRNTTGQDGVVQARGTAAWLATASRTVTPAALGTRTTAPATFGSQFPLRQNFQASASYVTGSHTLKVGGQWQWGRFLHRIDANADLVQNYTTATRVGNELVLSGPSSVIIRNTPILSQESMNADMGLYAQDSWRLNRLTVNYGVRWEWLNSSVDETVAPAGRFVPERTQPALKNIPNWKDFAPRLQAVYDVFGNSRTALKGSFNRYNTAQTTALAAGFNGLDSVTSTRTWTDLNGDNIAQGQRTWNATGRPYRLRVPAAGLRDQPERLTNPGCAVADLRTVVRSDAVRWLRPAVLPRDRLRSPARAAVAAVGDRFVVPHDVSQPDEDREPEPPVDRRRLRAADHLQSDRRHADHLLQLDGRLSGAADQQCLCQ